MIVAKFKEYYKDRSSSPLEKKLVRKIDIFILTFCCMAYFMNQLDHTNIQQAYVSGMKEELNFQGAQLTVIDTLYQTGYIVGIIPNNALLSKSKPRIFFPIMIVTWALITMCNAAAQTPQHLMVIRFFQGLAESCIFAGTHYILGSWYKEHELGKRTGLFTSSGLAGSMFSGFLQSAVYSGMNGLAGLAGWRWLFIIDGIITLPVALYGYLLFPDTPATTRAPYLSLEERQLARNRVPMVESKPILSMEFLKRILSSWYFYSFGLLWIITNCAEATTLNQCLSLYLKSSPNVKYTVYQLNNYPSGVRAMAIISTLFWVTLTDIFDGRWIPGYYAAITGVAGSAIILAPGTTEGGILGAYIWLGSILGCQGTFFAWANSSMRHEDDSFRAVILGAMNGGGNIFQVWWPLIFYRADAAPMFTLGMRAMIAVSIFLAIWLTVMIFVNRQRERRRDATIIDAVAEDKIGHDDQEMEAKMASGQENAAAVPVSNV